jgi:hypothetical protein
MKQRRRIYYSAAQRSEIWDRCRPAASVLRIGTVPNKRSAFLNERRFLDGSACAAHCGRLRSTWDDLRQPSALKSIVMAGRTVIELPGPIRLPGIGRGAPSFASWLAVRSRGGQYRPGCGGNGHRSKLPVGSSAHIRGNLKSRCHTRRSIAACSFRRAAC